MEENYNLKSMTVLKSIYRTLRTELLGGEDRELEGRIKNIGKDELIGLIRVHNRAICATGK